MVEPLLQTLSSPQKTSHRILRLHFQAPRFQRKLQRLRPNHNNLEDADVDAAAAGCAAASRGRRFIIDEEEEEEDGERSGHVAGLYDVESCEEVEELDQNDVVGRALHKCARMSAELKGELFGSSGTACERYSELDPSSVRILTQEDVDVACGCEDSDSAEAVSAGWRQVFASVVSKGAWRRPSHI